MNGKPTNRTEENVPYSARPDMVGGSLPAFPAQEQFDGGTSSGPIFYGLTKRELFAAMALQGMLTNQQFSDPGVIEDEYAIQAIQFADALLKELAK